VAWVIGGGAIYAAAMAFLSEVRITDVDLAVDGDTRAPQLSDEWMQEPADDGWRTSSTGIRYRFRVLRRQPSQTTSSSGTSSSIR
jgi:dihydrofolate reductase